MTVLQGLSTRLRLARLGCVTGVRNDAGQPAHDPAAFAAEVFAAGVDLLQLRDAAASRAAKLAALGAFRTAARGRGLVSVFAEPALARAFGADVWQLPDWRTDAREARRQLSEWALIGRSCDSADQVAAALTDDGVHFFTVGPTFGTMSGSRLPGLELVRHAAQVAAPSEPGAKPWFAIGGITLDNLDQVLDAGARRVMVGRAITAAADPTAAARVLGDRLRSAWSADAALGEVVLDAFRPPF